MSLLDPRRAALVLVDYQPRLMAAIHEGERITQAATRLAQIATTLSVPVVGTQQNPSRLGELDPSLAALCACVLDKTSFDSCRAGLGQVLRDLGPTLAASPQQLVVAGCEAHVCLLQTAMSLHEEGFEVWVCVDASGSRAPQSHGLAMRRLEQAGIGLVNVEMVAFEWLGSSDNEHFRAVQQLIK